MDTIVKRDSRIDFLRAIATLLVLNSHMGVCYKDYSFLATGGAIGDALFFFASGFTLYLGRMTSFGNWYKRRIMRIFPTVLVVGIIAALVFGNNDSFIDVIACKRYWFLPTIMVCYIPLYFVRRYLKDKQVVYIEFVYWILFSCVFFILYDVNALFYGHDSLWRKFFYFSIMLFGAIIGKYKEKFSWKPWMWIALFTCISLFYLFIFIFRDSSFQIVSSLPLMGCAFFVFLLGESKIVVMIDKTKFGGNLIYILGSICLESYLIQSFVISDRYNELFPINIVIIIVMVLVSSYLIHIVAEITRQIMDSNPFDWRKVLLYKH